MAREFDIEYDDFSGGFYVGNNETQQPRDTWVGDNVAVSPASGRLIPLVENTQVSDTSALISGVASVGFFGVDSNDVMHWSLATGVPTFYYQNYGITTSGFGAGAGNGTKAGPVQFAGKMCWAGDAAAAAPGVINARDVTTFALTNGNTPAAAWLATLGTYKYWLVGGDSTIKNRMFFSAPNDPVTWTATDYIDIGSTSNTITGFVDALDTLFVLTTGGMYAISGVLGSTATLRQVNKVPLAGGAPFDTAILGITSNVTAGNYDGPLVLAGSSGRRLLQDVADVTSMVQVGSSVFVNCGSAKFFYNDPMNARAWVKRTLSLPITTIMPSTVNRSEYMYSYASAGGAQRARRWQLNQTTAVLDSTGAFPTRTVTLPDEQRKDPFQVVSAIAEVVTGEASTQPRSVGVQIGGLSVLTGYSGGVATFDAAPSSNMVQSFTLGTTGATVAVKFHPNDAGPTLCAAPIVTLQGVELRRLVLRCKEVG